jgi:hypothetical protein
VKFGFVHKEVVGTPASCYGGSSGWDVAKTRRGGADGIDTEVASLPTVHM